MTLIKTTQTSAASESNTGIWCQAKFLTREISDSRHVRMHRVVFYISNTLRKLMVNA